VTSPPPPTGGLSQTEALDFYKTLRDASDASLSRAHLIRTLVDAALIALVALAGWRAYEWHVKDTAQLEARVQANQAAKDSAIASRDSADARAERWETRAEVAVARVRVDTQLIAGALQTVPAPVLVPVTSPAGIVSEVPMVPAETFDTLGARCTRLEHDCTQALAAKDSALSAKDSALAQGRIAMAHGDSLTALALKKASDAERANFFSKILYGLGGAVVGRASCSVR